MTYAVITHCPEVAGKYPFVGKITQRHENYDDLLFIEDCDSEYKGWYPINSLILSETIKSARSAFKAYLESERATNLIAECQKVDKAGFRKYRKHIVEQRRLRLLDDRIKERAEREAKAREKKLRAMAVE